MDDVSTSGPIDETFISEADIRTAYEDVPSHGFNRLMTVRRQGRWFMLKGLKAEYRDQAVYLELLRKEYALMVELDHPGIVKAYAKEVNEVLGPCIVMEYIDGVRLDEFLSGNPSPAVRRKVLDQLVALHLGSGFKSCSVSVFFAGRENNPIEYLAASFFSFIFR